MGDLPAQIRCTTHQKKLIDNHIDANIGKIKKYSCLDDFFGFCKIFKKVTKNLGFQLMFKTANLQDVIYTSMDDDINVTINNFYLIIPNLIPSVETQVVFIEATQNVYEITNLRRWAYRKTTNIRFFNSTWYRTGTTSEFS